MSSYAEGFMHGVAQATNSTISIESLYDYGAKKAKDRFYELEGNHNNYSYPKRKQVTEYDKGWFDGVMSTLKNVENPEVKIDITHPDYIPAYMVEKIITAAYNRELGKLRSDQRAKESHEYYKMKKEYAEKNYPKKEYSSNPNNISSNKEYYKRQVQIKKGKSSLQIINPNV
jgi:hypothetical protein